MQDLNETTQKLLQERKGPSKDEEIELLWDTIYSREISKIERVKLIEEYNEKATERNNELGQKKHVLI